MSDYLKVPELREPLIPLSVLALDLAEAPADGWAAFLAGQGISIEFDDLGRRAISRGDAKQLLDAQRQNEIRRQDLMARNEQAAIEADRQFRAGLHPGIPWHALPDGVLPASAMLQQAKDSEPRRTPSRNEWLFNETDTMVYHEFPAEDAS
jgi:hypothetical protein